MEEQALVIALVGVLGIGAQWVAWRTGWPAIVLMLAAGFLAGPIFGIFNPERAFGELLEPMVAIGVALILFEGGLSLDLRELREHVATSFGQVRACRFSMRDCLFQF